MIYTTQSLTKKLSNDIIKKFDKEFAEVASYNISGRPGWEAEDGTLFEKLTRGTEKYLQALKKQKKGVYPFCTQSVSDTGYRIQRIPRSLEKNNVWVSDFNGRQAVNEQVAVLTCLTYIWFLSDINSGGRLEFSDGTRVTAKAGKLIIFPAVWSLTYQIDACVNDVYICAGNMVCGPVNKVSTPPPITG